MSESRWLRVKVLFHEALEHTGNERSAFLSTACGDDSTVRAEVERLLVAHEAAGAFIEQSPATGSHHRLTGRSVGRYEVGRLIGAGGMGEVYAARDVELGPDVALKIGSDTDLVAQARLRREAQHASQLNHPHICTIHEVGVRWPGLHRHGVRRRGTALGAHSTNWPRSGEGASIRGSSVGRPGARASARRQSS